MTALTITTPKPLGELQGAMAWPNETAQIEKVTDEQISLRGEYIERLYSEMADLNAQKVHLEQEVKRMLRDIDTIHAYRYIALGSKK